MTKDATGWTKQHASKIAKDVRSRTGGGWDYFSPVVQRALIESECLTLVRMQMTESVKVRDINDLLRMALEAAGVSDI